MSWYRLSSLTGDPHELRARFVPDTLADTGPSPVLDVLIREPHDPEGARRALDRFHESFVADYSFTAVSFTAVDDYEYVETVVHGKSVEVGHSAYSAEEALHIARELRASLRKATELNARHHRKLQELSGFLHELIVRAESKRTLSTRHSPGPDAQLDVLKRVLNRLGDG